MVTFTADVKNEDDNILRYFLQIFYIFLQISRMTFADPGRYLHILLIIINIYDTRDYGRV